MTYELFIGDKSFSSWSLRGWLLFKKFNIEMREIMVGLYTGTMAQDLAPLHPARLVPSVRTPEGDVIGESSALIETLAERHPDAGLWPTDASERIFARWMVAEMHAGFSALRGECAMQLLHKWVDFEVSEAVVRDLGRLSELFEHAQAKFGHEGPWVFGEYSAVDAYYAPVAARIAGYGLPVGPRLQSFVDATLSDAAFNEWRDDGLKVSYDPIPYALPLKTAPWPA